MFPDHFCRGQVCLRASHPQAHLHHEFKGARASTKALLILRMSRFVLRILCKLHDERFQLKSRVAIGQQLHTREVSCTDQAMRSCYHQNLSNDKRVTSLGLPCDNRQCHQWAYSPTSGATFLNTARATRRPQSSRMNARRAEALSSASQVSEFLLIKLVSRSPWQGPEHPL